MRLLRYIIIALPLIASSSAYAYDTKPTPNSWVATPNVEGVPAGKVKTVKLTPPSWLTGSWYLYDKEGTQVEKRFAYFIVTANNIYELQLDLAHNTFYDDSFADLANVKEKTEGNKYIISYTYSGGSSSVTFEKGSSKNNIIYYPTKGESYTYTKGGISQ